MLYCIIKAPHSDRMLNMGSCLLPDCVVIPTDKRWVKVVDERLHTTLFLMQKELERIHIFTQTDNDVKMLLVSLDIFL